MYTKLSSTQITVCVVEISGKGGICHYTYNLCNNLGEKIVTKLVSSTHYELVGYNKKFLYYGIFNRFKTSPFKLIKIFRYFKKNKPAIIHFQLSQYPSLILILMLLCKFFLKTKVIITAHNVISHEEKFYNKWIFSNIYRIADKIIVHAFANKGEMINLFSLSHKKIEVIPHGNYMFFNQLNKNVEIASCCEIDNSIPVILFFGYIRKYKGLMYLIQSMPQIIKLYPKAKLIIAGNPVEPFDEYQKEINKLNLSSNIIVDLQYIPFEKVRFYFQKSTVVVLPYLKVYQSGILQLAYGFSKPVVVTNTGGLIEAVKEGETGYIVPPKDVSAMAAAIIKIISDMELAKKMGVKAQSFAEKEFSWESVAEKTITVYRKSLLGK